MMIWVIVLFWYCLVMALIMSVVAIVVITLVMMLANLGNNVGNHKVGNDLVFMLVICVDTKFGNIC